MNISWKWFWHTPIYTSIPWPSRWCKLSLCSASGQIFFCCIAKVFQCKPEWCKCDMFHRYISIFSSRLPWCRQDLGTFLCHCLYYCSILALLSKRCIPSLDLFIDCFSSLVCFVCDSTSKIRNILHLPTPTLCERLKEDKKRHSILGLDRNWTLYWKEPFYCPRYSCWSNDSESSAL